MTNKEAIKGLKALSKEFSGYKPNEEMFDMAIKALELVTINSDPNEIKVTICNYKDTIYRQDAIDAVEESRRLNHHQDGKEARAHEYEHRHFLKILMDLPAAQPRKKGKWIVWNGMDIPENHRKHICSECGEFAPIEYDKPIIREKLTKFCPDCGSYNGGEQE